MSILLGTAISEKHLAYVGFCFGVVIFFLFVYCLYSYDKEEAKWKKFFAEFLADDEKYSSYITSSRCKSPFIIMLGLTFITIAFSSWYFYNQYDPKKELAESGFTWDESEISKTIRTNDIKSFKLFMEGGMHLSTSDVKNILFHQNEDFSHSLNKYTDLVNPTLCFSLLTSLSQDERKTLQSIAVKEKLNLIKNICSKKETKTLIENKLNDEKKYYESELDRVKVENSRKESPDVCFKTEVKNNYADLLNEASESYKSSMQFTLSEREYLLRRIYILLIASPYPEISNDYINELHKKIDPLVNEYCEKQAKLISEPSDEDIKFWQQIYNLTNQSW